MTLVALPCRTLSLILISSALELPHQMKCGVFRRPWNGPAYRVASRLPACSDLQRRDGIHR